MMLAKDAHAMNLWITDADPEGSYPESVWAAWWTGTVWTTNNINVMRGFFVRHHVSYEELSPEEQMAVIEWKLTHS